MPLTIYSQQQIQNVLHSLALAGREADHQAGGVLDVAYWKGYKTALVTMALAFGIVPLGEAKDVTPCKTMVAGLH